MSLKNVEDVFPMMNGEPSESMFILPFEAGLKKHV